MTKKIINLSIIFCLWVMSHNLFSQEILPLKEVKAGMKGYGLTVVQGEKPVRFEVEIIDVLENVEPKKSVILAKFSGPVIEKSGIAQGMSGSPIYIDGKLIGALAYTWGYLKESIGGIQPIEQMLPVLQKIQTSQKEPFRFVSLDEKLSEEMKTPYYLEKISQSSMRPIGTPLLLAGFSSDVFYFLKEKFEKAGFVVLQGSGGGKNIISSQTTLEPGDAVAIQLARGDVSASAIGTVTYRVGNQVLIFGHPFMNQGFGELPLTKAFVHYVLPSLQVSWKFASSTEEIGVVYNDRKTAVAGEIGKKAKMIPIRLLIDSEERKENFYYEITPDPLFFPNLFAGIIMSSFMGKESEVSEGSVLLDCVLRVKNLKTNQTDLLRLNDFFIGTNKESSYQAVFKIIYPIQFLIYNWFNEIALESIEISLKKIPFYAVAAIEKAIVQNDSIKPGENVTIRVLFRLYKGGYAEKTIEYTLPKNIPGDYAIIHIASAKLEYYQFTTQVAPNLFPKSYAQLLAFLQTNNRYNSLCIWTDNNQQITALIDGNLLPSLPLSKLMNYAFREMGHSFIKLQRSKKYEETNYLLTGYVPVFVKINRDN